MAKGLGRGLGALIPSYQTDEEVVDGVNSKGIVPSMISIDKIIPNKNQPRKNFLFDQLDELSQSIKEHGVIQPILVVEDDNGYKIVAGERRYRASVKAGLKEVPVIIKDFTEKEILQIALIENLQREDLNDIEEAMAYKELSEKFKMTQDEIGKKLGKSRVYIANTVRLLGLSDKIQKLIIDGRITAGHGRAILSVRVEEYRDEFADIIVERGLTVRQAEDMSPSFAGRDEEREARKATDKPVYITTVEENLSDYFATKVNIVQLGKDKKKGKIELNYYSYDDLERLLQKLNYEENYEEE